MPFRLKSNFILLSFFSNFSLFRFLKTFTVPYHLSWEVKMWQVGHIPTFSFRFPYVYAFKFGKPTTIHHSSDLCTMLVLILHTHCGWMDDLPFLRPFQHYFRHNQDDGRVIMGVGWGGVRGTLCNKAPFGLGSSGTQPSTKWSKVESGYCQRAVFPFPTWKMAIGEPIFPRNRFSPIRKYAIREFGMAVGTYVFEDKLSTLICQFD